MKKGTRAAVLAYHSHNIHGLGYQENDLIAFAEDVAFIQAAGYNLVSLSQVAESVIFGHALPDRAVALSCDDGADYDFIDILHETWGMQTSFGTTLRQSGQGVLTSFVIADPLAREEIDKKCLAGVGRMNDSWWVDAIGSGVLHIGNHSWDHQHPCLDRYADIPPERLEFNSVDTYEAADYQLRQATGFLRGKALNPGCALFAYPYGHWTDYLVQEYLPHHLDAHRLEAAFTTEPEIVHAGSSRWLLPRFVFGPHWRTQSELHHILKQL